MPGFRDTMLDYFNRVWRLGRDLHRGFALDLGLEPDFFETKLDRPIATLRLLHYPPVEGPLADGQTRRGSAYRITECHFARNGCVGGLMVRDRSGRWLDAPVVPGAFVCNIGDCLMRWSNDVYVSTPHKVVSPPGKDRYSVAFFLDPNPDAIVACLPTCVEPRTGRPNIRRSPAQNSFARGSSQPMLLKRLDRVPDQLPERDDYSLNCHLALSLCWSTISSEHRCPLFPIMLDHRRPIDDCAAVRSPDARAIPRLGTFCENA